MRTVYKSIALALVSAVFLPGCPPEEPPEAPVEEPAARSTALDVLQADPRFAAFLAYVDDDTRAVLDARTDVTVLAPTGPAMAAIPDLCLTIWDSNGRMPLFIQHHLAFDEVRLSRADLAAIGQLPEGDLEMLAGGAVRLTTGADGALTANGRALGDSQVADNGFVHTLEGQALVPAALADDVGLGCVGD